MHNLIELISSRSPEFSVLPKFRGLIRSTLDSNNNPKDNSDLLHLIIQHKKDVFLQELINSSNLNLEILNEELNMTPIQFALARGSLRSVEILMQAGAKLDVLWSTEDTKLNLLHMLDHEICAHRSYLEKTYLKDILISTMKHQDTQATSKLNTFGSMTFCYQKEQMDNAVKKCYEHSASPVGTSRMFKIS